MSKRTQTPVTEPANDRYQQNPPVGLSLAEKKRLQWEKERVERDSAWNPFGRPGAGAPTRTDGLRQRPDEPNPQMTQPYQNYNSPPERIATQQTASTPASRPAPAPAPKPEVYHNPAMDRDQSNIPMAMRSSVAFGDSSVDWVAKNKENERKRWLEDLERQREEQRRRKGSDQRDDNRDDSAITTPSSYQPPQIQPTPDVDSTHMRGHNWLIDPAQKEENERRRKKMVEQQQAIQEQVQEKQRQKQAEKERIQKEEREQEERISQERAKILQEVEQEKLKVKQKQENELKRSEMLKKTLEEAAERAKAEKRKKLTRHTSQGDDDEPPKVQESKTPRGQDSKPPLPPPKVQESKPSLPAQEKRPEPLPAQKSVETEAHAYTERVLTPSSHRPREAASAWSTSTCREFGTQTETDVSKILNRVYKPSSADSSSKLRKNDPKSNPQGNPTQKGRGEERHVAWKEKEKPVTQPKGNVKGAAPERNQKPPMPRKTRSGNPPKKMLKQSERDPFYAEKKRDGEERRARRQEEMRHLQEMNDAKLAQHRTKSRSRSVPAPTEETNRKPQKSSMSHADSTHHLPEKLAIRSKSPPVPVVQKQASTLQAKKFQDNEVVEKDDLSDTFGADVDQTMRRRLMGEVSPSLAHVFVPMVRTKEFLDPAQAYEPLPPSRESTAVKEDRERARQNYYHSQEPRVYGTQVQNIVDQSDDIPLRTSTYYYPDSFRGSHEKDPLYNPRLVKENPTMRQSHILQQLNILKQSLIMKQREFVSSQAFS